MKKPCHWHKAASCGTINVYLQPVKARVDFTRVQSNIRQKNRSGSDFLTKKTVRIWHARNKTVPALIVKKKPDPNPTLKINLDPDQNDLHL